MILTVLLLLTLLLKQGIYDVEVLSLVLCSTGGNTATAADYAHFFFSMYTWKGRGQILNCILSVSQWHCCDSQRMFVLQGLRPMKEKVCFFLLLAALPSLCMCHHVLGKYFDVVLAFWRLIPLRASLDVEARIEQSAHAVLSLNERINPSEITLIKTGEIMGLCLTYFHGIG